MSDELWSTKQPLLDLINKHALAQGKLPKSKPRSKPRIHQYDGYQKGQIVKTPSGKLAKVVGFTGLSHWASTSVRAIIHYIDVQSPQNGQLTLKLELLQKQVVSQFEIERGL